MRRKLKDKIANLREKVFNRAANKEDLDSSDKSGWTYTKLRKNDMAHPVVKMYKL